MSSYIRKGSTRRSDDTMDDDTDDKDDTKRKSRNLSEKKRRDQFNMLVNELSSMVSTGSRKMDKSTVLKSTISFLKNHNAPGNMLFTEVAVRSRAHEIQEDWKPAFLSNEEFTHLILEALDGFIVVFSTAGQIYYASESITSLLGYLPSDLLNMTIFDMAHEDEQSMLYNVLLNQSTIDSPASFSCHIKRSGPHLVTEPSYELVQFVGYFRSDVDMFDGDSSRFSNFSNETDPNRLVFVGTGRLQTPQLIREMSVVDSTKSEFTSRHSLEWKFLFLDHRAPPIIGYLPFEVLGTSGYDYYHVDDLDKVVTCHEALMQKGEATSCYYRFLTKGQQWIWLQTRFYITYHQWNSKPEFIVCTHRVVSYVDVMKQARKEATDASTTEVSSSPWPRQDTKPNIRTSSTRPPAPPSDCTSMSADSPASRHSMATQHSSVRAHNSKRSRMTSGSRSSVQNQTQNQSQAIQIDPQVQAHFIESPQYVAAIPIQPAVISFPASTMISPLISEPVSVDCGSINSEQAQVQAQLQRKHAELQALIGQQQAELRRVSEQLVMARFGILPGTQQQTTQSQQTTHAPALLNVTVPYVCTGGVSSTTTSSVQNHVIPTVQLPVTLPVVTELITAPVDDSSSFSLTQQQAQMLFHSPNSTTQSHNNK